MRKCQDHSTGCEKRDSAQPKFLEAILNKDNLNRAYKRVKANKGTAGTDGMTVEEALPYLKEHGKELTERISRGKYIPSPVRQIEIPKPKGGVRGLGIPTVIDRIIQQAIAQKLMPIYELLFAEGSYGYRPNRSAKDAILKVKEYSEQGYIYAVSQDLSKYFDSLNHEILINLLRKEVKDKAVESDENGSARGLGMDSGNEQTGLLIHNTYSCHKHGNDKRKTDKQRLL